MHFGIKSLTTNTERSDYVIKNEKGNLTVLNYENSFCNVEELKANKEFPDPFTFLNGNPVKSINDWEERSREISAMYQYYMYGVLPDPCLEEVGYEINKNEMLITVKKGGRKVSFPVTVRIPDKEKVIMPSGGFPVIISFLNINQVEYANLKGYAVITIETKHIAADNSSREGIFYELYPYGRHWTEQTGSLMAWAWGAFKVIDALEAGAASYYDINQKNVILTGVSRWGKAAALAGAMDKRIKVTAPSCSGSGGIASFRYKSEGRIYDYSSIGIAESYKVGTNEPLGSLQSPDERHWFNDNFLRFSGVEYLPFDQHFLAALCAAKDRYLFITGSYIKEDWVNPTGMWATYLAAKKVYDVLGVSENIAIHFHKEGHMVTDEDMVYLLDFCDSHFYGKCVASDLSELHKSLYQEPANYDEYFNQFINV